MGERTKHAPIQDPLPDKAKQWLDAQRAEMMAQGLADPNTRHIFEQMQQLTEMLNPPRYSVRGFRELHYLTYPESSIAGLAINDELFLEVIQHDTYTVDELAKKLNTGEISAETFGAMGCQKSRRKIRMLQRALEAWKKARQNSC